MIVLRSPKGWTGPAELNGKKLEGFWRSHQMPLPEPKRDPALLKQLEAWLQSYRPEELFDGQGSLIPECGPSRQAASAAWALIPMPMEGCCAMPSPSTLTPCGCSDRMKPPPTGCKPFMRSAKSLDGGISARRPQRQ
jgi:hypothetical protein